MDDYRLETTIFLLNTVNQCHFVGMLVYFLYGIHHSKEGESNSSYSILMTSSEAVKEKWGSTTKTNLKSVLTHRKATSLDKAAIIDDDDDDSTD